MIFWVEDDGKESLVRLPDRSDPALNELFQKIYAAAGVEDDQHIYLL